MRNTEVHLPPDGHRHRSQSEAQCRPGVQAEAQGPAPHPRHARPLSGHLQKFHGKGSSRASCKPVPPHPGGEEEVCGNGKKLNKFRIYIYLIYD